MSHYIVIREYKQSDYEQVAEVLKKAYLSNVNHSFYNALTREITFQLIVACAAFMFIFMHIHLLFCVISVPIVMIGIYLSIYMSFYIKSVELMQTKRPLQCWVAEACQPLYSFENARNLSYRIITEQKVWDEGIDIGCLHRKIIGTVSVSNYLHVEDSSWLFRLAVDSNYRHKGIGHALVQTVKSWSRQKNYLRLLLVMSECQDNARQLFVSTGFELKQMYHKQLMGTFVSILMYQLECDLHRPIF